MNDDGEGNEPKKQTLEEWLKLGNTINQVEGTWYEQAKKPIRMRGARPMKGRGK